jgi:Ca2+-binding RTX toxin-like protein
MHPGYVGFSLLYRVEEKPMAVTVRNQLNSIAGEALTDTEVGAFLIVTSDGFVSAENAVTLSGGMAGATIYGAINGGKDTGTGLTATGLDTLLTVAASGTISGATAVRLTDKTTLNNYGLIDGGTGVASSAGSMTLNNYGTIFGRTLNATSGHVDAVAFTDPGTGFAAAINNHGIVAGSMSFTTTHASSTLQLNNTGRIQGNVYSTSFDNTILNRGTIYERYIGADGKDVITNSGMIRGGMNLAGGRNELTNESGGVIAGHVELGVAAGTGGAQDWNVVHNQGEMRGLLKLGSGRSDVDNRGVIGSIESWGMAEIDNHGTVTGDIDLSGAGRGSTLYNKGLIKGSVRFGDDSDYVSSGTGRIFGTVTLGGGDDRFEGASSSIRADGGTGNDYIAGSHYNDTLSGGDGVDWLRGGGGNDLLFGGAGKDWLDGGDGRDVFFYRAKSDSTVAEKGRDLISDFQLRADKINLKAIDANDKKAGDQAFIWKGTAAFTGTAGELRVIYPKVTELPGGGTSWDHPVRVLGDTNGDKVADFAIGLHPSAFKLSAADFVL